MVDRPTSRDVAERAGVSRTAVSMVLNGRAEGAVSAERQQAVLRAAEELGYAPDPVALGLRRDRTGSVGVVVEDLEAAGSAAALAGASEAAQQAGVALVVVDLAGGPPRQAYADLVARRVDAVLHVGRASVPSEDVEVSVVTVEGAGPGEPRAAGERALRSLLDALAADAP